MQSDLHPMVNGLSRNSVLDSFHTYHWYFSLCALYIHTTLQHTLPASMPSAILHSTKTHGPTMVKITLLLFELCFVLLCSCFWFFWHCKSNVRFCAHLCASIHVWCCIFAVCTDLQVKWTCDFIQRRQFLGEFSSFQFLIQKMCVNECQQLSDW